MNDRYAMFHRLLLGLDPAWVAEHRFHPTRRWRFDFANPCRMLAIEIDGGLFARQRGRHSRGAGQVRDMEKGNAAVALGWSVLHFTPDQVRDGSAYRFLTNMDEV